MSPGDDASSRWGEAQREVEEFLLDGERFLRRGDVAERAGVGPEQTARLWSALGFPRIPDDVDAFAQVDLDALQLVQELLGDGSLDEAEALAIARTLGQSMARLAEWQANLLRRTIVERGPVDDPDAVVDSVRTLVPLLEKLQAYTWRRHLIVTAGPDDGRDRRRRPTTGPTARSARRSGSPTSSASPRSRARSTPTSCARCWSGSRASAPTWWRSTAGGS